MAWYWCLDEGKPESDENGGKVCRAEVRLGPYPTEAAARGALDELHERQRKADAEDRAWRDEGKRS